MHHKNIDLILTFLSLFLITNVFGATGASNLAPSVQPNYGELENSLCKTHLVFCLNFGKHFELFDIPF